MAKLIPSNTNTTDHCFVPFLLPPSCLGLTDSRFRVSLLSRIASSNGHASWCIQIYKAVYGIYLINCAGSLSFGDYFKGGLSPCCRSYSPLPAWRIRWPYSLRLWLAVIRFQLPTSQHPLSGRRSERDLILWHLIFLFCFRFLLN
jgi:hypothetical protein